jgi:aldehyde dehydrogenase (NAD(P)+)
VGFVHNPLMFGAVQKSVIRSPFRAWPKPPWFASHRSAGRLVPELIRYEADRSPLRLVSIAIEALRG